MTRRPSPRLLIGLFAVCAFPSADGDAQAGGHAPAGVFGFRTSDRGSLSTSYRFVRTALADNFIGSEVMATREVLDRFLVAPLTMVTDQHVLRATYGISQVVTLAAMANHTRVSMDNVTRSNVAFADESSGFGDLWLGALTRLRRAGAVRAHLHAGVWLPTGSIENVGGGADGDEAAQLPYPMQIGSGTMDVAPGLTVAVTGNLLSWGVQTQGRLPLGDNSRGWRRGVALEATAWTVLKIGERLGFTAGIRGKYWGNYQGSDPAYASLGPERTPTIRADLQGGSQVEAPVGVSIRLPGGGSTDRHVSVEWSMPLVRDLKGPQLGAEWALAIGLRAGFR